MGLFMKLYNCLEKCLCTLQCDSTPVIIHWFHTRLSVCEMIHHSSHSLINGHKFISLKNNELSLIWSQNYYGSVNYCYLYFEFIKEVIMALRVVQCSIPCERPDCVYGTRLFSLRVRASRRRRIHSVKCLLLVDRTLCVLFLSEKHFDRLIRNGSSVELSFRSLLIFLQNENTDKRKTTTTTTTTTAFWSWLYNMIKKVPERNRL